MDQKLKQNLAKAEEYFYSLRLADAYAILRRYFDRLPFRAEPDHARYIGMFARVLCELGKENELNFYMSELEKLREKFQAPEIDYQLAVVYTYLQTPRSEQSRRLLEGVLRNPDAKALHVKSKLMLADYFDRVHGDVASCRQLIDSIGEVADPELQMLVQIWHGKVLRDEKKFSEAETVLKNVLLKVDPKVNWYAFFSVRLVLAILYIKQDRRDDARALVEEVRKLFVHRHFKSALVQLLELEKLVEEKGIAEPLKFYWGKPDSVLQHANRSLELKHESRADKLLILFMKKRFVRKEAIVKSLYNRDYEAARDDKLIYYHVHAARKRLGTIGVAADAIESEQDGYRFVPEVSLMEEEL